MLKNIFTGCLWFFSINSKVDDLHLPVLEALKGECLAQGINIFELEIFDFRCLSFRVATNRLGNAGLSHAPRALSSYLSLLWILTCENVISWTYIHMDLLFLFQSLGTFSFKSWMAQMLNCHHRARNWRKVNARLCSWMPSPWGVRIIQ